MCFGIDISGYQTGLDLGRAKAEGVEFVIVKAVASYQPGLTRAAGYVSNIDRAFSAGITGKGHYAVPNSRNTPEATADFMWANRYRYDRSQVLALDNEPLDTYKVFWRDAEAARFFRRLHAISGHPYPGMWLYCPAALTRANAPWPECEALGVRFWWAAYGGNPTGHAPDHIPALGGSISHYDVHQFSSRCVVAGQAVDGNTSPHSVGTLFNASAPSGGGSVPIEEGSEMGTPNYHWAGDSPDFPRGGVLLTDDMGPIFPPTDEYAEYWKQEYPAPGGTDIDGRKWDVLIQSCRDRKALKDAQIALASPAIDLTAEQIVAALVPAVVAALSGEVGLSADEVQAATERAVRRVLADAATEEG